MSLLGKLFAFMWVRKKYWLLPLVVVMILVGWLLGFTDGAPDAEYLYPGN
jgi:hypothetical protein